MTKLLTPAQRETIHYARCHLHTIRFAATLEAALAEVAGILRRRIHGTVPRWLVVSERDPRYDSDAGTPPYRVTANFGAEPPVAGVGGHGFRTLLVIDPTHANIMRHGREEGW